MSDIAILQQLRAGQSLLLWLLAILGHHRTSSCDPLH